MANVNTLSLKGFLAHVDQIRLHDSSRRFCFILGAGASIASGIPAAASLAEVWLKEMHDQSLDAEAIDFESWMQRELHEINQLDRNDLASMYFDIYAARFRDPRTGARYLETLMEEGKPSYGYYAIAYVLANTKDNLVITVNFDNLIADALHFYARTHPIICGHEKVAPLMPTIPHRPMVIKVHHDIYLEPLNNPAQMVSLGEGFTKKLPQFLEAYTPIVVGYGGNDRSLMGALEDCATIGGSLYWCYREGSIPSARVSNLVQKHNGYFVCIPGFDDFFAQYAAGQGFLIVREDLVKAYEEDIDRMIDAGSRLAAATSGQNDADRPQTDETLKALDETFPAHSKTQNWWHYELQAIEGKNWAEKEAAYEEGLRVLPLSSQLLGNFANALWRERKDPDRAQEFYEKAITAAPNDSNVHGNYANFLWRERKAVDKAQTFFEKAMELGHPVHPTHLNNYANFLSRERHDYDKAHELYEASLEGDPNNVNSLGNYANFLWEIRHVADKARSIYERAINLEPNHANNLGNFAEFLWKSENDLDKSQEYYDKAIEADPKGAYHLGNYANFLWKERKELDKAQEFFEAAIKADPKRTSNIDSYTNFMEEARAGSNASGEILKKLGWLRKQSLSE